MMQCLPYAGTPRAKIPIPRRVIFHSGSGTLQFCRQLQIFRTHSTSTHTLHCAHTRTKMVEVQSADFNLELNSDSTSYHERPPLVLRFDANMYNPVFSCVSLSCSFICL